MKTIEGGHPAALMSDPIPPLQRVQEAGGGQNRESFAQGKEVSVARHKEGPLRFGEREEIVVVRVPRVVRPRWRVRSDACLATQKIDQRRSLISCDVPAKLRISQSLLELAKQRVRHDQFEIASQPTRESLRGRASSGKQGRDENVGIENDAHRSAPAPPRPFLRLGCERKCRILGEIVALPESIEQIKSKLSAQGFLDYLAIALARSRPADANRAENVLVDGQRRASLWHIRIIAS